MPKKRKRKKVSTESGEETASSRESYIESLKKPIPRSRINEFLGREVTEEDEKEEITVRAWLEEEGYDLIQRGELTQTDVANMFGLHPSRVSHLCKKIKERQEEAKREKYRRILGIKKEKLLKKGNKNKKGDNMSDEEQPDELTGDEKELIELMDAMGVSERVQAKVITLYKRVPHHYNNHHALYQLLVTCGIKPDWARTITANFLLEKVYSGSPEVFPQNIPPPNIPINPAIPPYPYGFPYPSYQNINDGRNRRDDDKDNTSKMLEKMMTMYFSKAITDMFSNQNRQGVPFVAAEVVKRPVVGPDGNILLDENGNIIYEEIRREKPLSPMMHTPHPPPPPQNKDTITLKDILELLKTLRESEKTSPIEKELFKTLQERLESVESKLIDEKINKIYEEINAIRSYDPMEQYIRWKKMFDELFPSKEGGENIDLVKLKLDHDLKMRELDMKLHERSEARDLVESLRRTLDTGITNIGGPLASAVAAGIERKLSEIKANPHPTSNNPTSSNPSGSSSGNPSNIDFSQMSDEQLQMYINKINEAKSRVSNLEHKIKSELQRRMNSVSKTATATTTESVQHTNTTTEPATPVKVKANPVTTKKKSKVTKSKKVEEYEEDPSLYAVGGIVTP